MPRALLAALLLAAAAAYGADAAVSLDVPAGRAKNIRLKSLPRGTVVAVRVVSNGKLLIALLSERQVRSPEPGRAPLFRAVVESTITFRVEIPESGDYYLVLSNRGGAEPRAVQAEIRAQGAPAPKSAPANPVKLQGA